MPFFVSAFPVQARAAAETTNGHITAGPSSTHTQTTEADDADLGTLFAPMADQRTVGVTNGLLDGVRCVYERLLKEEGRRRKPLTCRQSDRRRASGQRTGLRWRQGLERQIARGLCIQLNNLRGRCLRFRISRCMCLPAACSSSRCRSCIVCTTCTTRLALRHRRGHRP